MEKLTFKKEEVVAFLEEIINENAATEEQEELYQDYKWNGKLNKNNYTYKFTIAQMRKLWNEQY